MKNLLIILAFFSIINSFSQCKKGNCINGNGTFDFGWCVYTGEFKNSKPDGKGTMKYDDYSYDGNFTDGLENGEGLITNTSGTIENVKYQNGIKQVSYLEKIASKDYKPLVIQDVNCISGDCINGFGTFKYSSGNKYTGNRVNYKMEGKGIFYFTNGEVFDGTFSNNLFKSGTYNYATGAKYTGTYDDKGLELNGTITSPTGIPIPYVNGKPAMPPKVNRDEIKRINTHERVTNYVPMKGSCSVCFGRGSQSRLEDWSNSTSTCLMRIPVTCYKCFGTGVEK